MFLLCAGRLSSVSSHSVFWILIGWGLLFQEASIATQAHSPTRDSAKLIRKAVQFDEEYRFLEASKVWQETLAFDRRNQTAILGLLYDVHILEGYAKARSVAAEFLKANPDLKRETKRAVSSTILALRSRFATDRGQSAYLQGKTWAERDHCDSAFHFFEKALSDERGNSSVLTAQLECERKLRRWDSYYSTLQQLWDPVFSKADLGLTLAEMHVSFGQSAKASDLLKYIEREFALTKPQQSKRHLVEILIQMKSQNPPSWKEVTPYVQRALRGKGSPAVLSEILGAPSHWKLSDARAALWRKRVERCEDPYLRCPAGK